MANYILNFTRGGTTQKKGMPAQARELLQLGLWGVPASAQLKGKIVAAQFERRLATSGHITDRSGNGCKASAVEDDIDTGRGCLNRIAEGAGSFVGAMLEGSS